jgi:hypothetical protein
MKMADDYMKANNFPLGVLHAAPAAAHLYGTLGWQVCSATYNVMNIRPGELTAFNAKIPSSVLPEPRLVDFGSQAELSLMKALHSMVASNVFGSFARVDGYWPRWVARSNDTRRKIIRYTLGDPRKSGDLVGYVIVETMVADIHLETEIAIQIREFFAGKVTNPYKNDLNDVQVEPVDAGLFVKVLARLVMGALDAAGVQHSKRGVKLHLTGAAMPFEALDAAVRLLGDGEGACPWIVAERRDVAVDGAWMFKLQSPFVYKRPDGTETTISTTEDAIKVMKGTVSKFSGCKDVVADKTEAFGFFKTDNF